MPRLPHVLRRAAVPGYARRRILVALVAGGAAFAVWQAIGPDRPEDVASELTDVRDAAVDLPSEAGPMPRDAEAWQVAAASGDGPCAVSVEAETVAAATLSLAISAPCAADARVDVVQADFAVSARLDAAGGARLDMPALSEAPQVAVLVEGAAPVALQAHVTDFELYQRAVVHWGGRPGLQLHAFENGAGWGARGHVGPDAPRTIAAALTGEGGYIVRLGDPSVEDGLTALVYTAPAGLAADLTVEAAVTEESCGRRVDAATMRVGPGLHGTARSLTMTVPGCQAVGDYVMIDDALEPVTRAAD